MLIKTRTAHGEWRWIDGVVDVESFGTVPSPVQSSENPPGEYFAVVSTMEEAQAAVARMWGDQREFDVEVWPSFDVQTGRGRTLTTAVARFRAGGTWLLVLDDETFLLSETGDTIDRLR